MIPAPSHSHPDPNPPPPPQPPRPLREARTLGSSKSGKQLSLSPHRSGAKGRPEDSADPPAPRARFSVSAVQAPSSMGLPRLPPGPRGAALTAQQEEEAERSRSPRAGRREPRAAGCALSPERGHRAASRRGGAVALSRARAGAPISPAQAPGSRAASSQGLGRLRPRGGRGRRPGPAGWRGSHSPTRPWRPPLPPPCRRWPTLSSSSPCGAGQLPS